MLLFCFWFGPACYTIILQWLLTQLLPDDWAGGRASVQSIFLRCLVFTLNYIVGLAISFYKISYFWTRWFFFLQTGWVWTSTQMSFGLPITTKNWKTFQSCFSSRLLSFHQTKNFLQVNNFFQSHEVQP
jgi:hypothetical protein